MHLFDNISGVSTSRTLTPPRSLQQLSSQTFRAAVWKQTTQQHPQTQSISYTIISSQYRDLTSRGRKLIVKYLTTIRQWHRAALLGTNEEVFSALSRTLLTSLGTMSVLRHRVLFIPLKLDNQIEQSVLCRTGIYLMSYNLCARSVSLNRKKTKPLIRTSISPLAAHRMHRCRRTRTLS